MAWPKNMQAALYYNRKRRRGLTASAPGVTVSSQTIDFGGTSPADTGGAQAKTSAGTYVNFVSVLSVVSGDGANWGVNADGRLERTSGTPASSNGAVLLCNTTLGPINVTIRSSGNDDNGNDLSIAYSCNDGDEVDAACNIIDTGTGIILCRPVTMTIGWDTHVMKSHAFTSLLVTAHDRINRPVIYDQGVHFNDTQNITFEHFEIYGPGLTSSTRLFNLINACDNITIRYCHAHGEELDPNADYSASGSYVNPSALGSDGQADSTNITFTNNYITDVYNGCLFRNGGDVVVKGNAVYRTYNDAYRFTYSASSTSITFTDNTAAQPIGLSSDTDNPHCDAVQFYNATNAEWAGVVCERNRFWIGDARGNWQLIFSDTRLDNPLIRGNVGVTSGSSHGITLGRLFAGGRIYGNTMVQDVSQGAPAGGLVPVISVGATSSAGNVYISNNVTAKPSSLLDAATFVETNNVVMGLDGGTNAYADTFDGGFTTLDTLAQVMTAFSMLDDGPLDATGGSATTHNIGAIGSGYVTFDDELDFDGASIDSSFDPVPAISLTDPAGSLKFPDNNHETDQAGTYAALSQSTDNIDTGLLQTDSAVFAIVGLPWDRMHTNADMKIVGHNTYSSGRRFSLSVCGSDHNTSSRRRKFRGFVKGSTSTALLIDSAECTEERVLVVFKRSGDDHSVDFYSLADGTKTAGPVTTDAANVGINSYWGGDAFGVGVGQDTSGTPASGSLLRDGTVRAFPGEISAVGFVFADVSDADWQSIALGADIGSVLDAADVPWVREFTGNNATSLAAPAWATSDTSDDTDVIDGGNLLPGSHIRRQDTTNYLTIDYIPTGKVYALKDGAASRGVTFSGTAGGYTGNVEVRIVGEDGTIHKGWTVVGAIASGVWSGSITVAKMDQWCWLQARPASTPAVIAEMRETFGVGYKFAIVGQSQTTLWAAFTNLDYNVEVANRRRVSSSMNRQFDFVVQPEQMFRVGARPGSDGVVAFVDQWCKVADAAGDTTPVMLVLHGESGTSAVYWIDDNVIGSPAGDRDWADTQEINDYVGSDFTGVVWQWGTSDISLHATYGADVFDAVIKGTGSNAADHYILDGNTFDADTPMILSPFGRDVGSTAGPFTTDDELSMSMAVSQQNYFENEGWTIGPQLPDVEIKNNNGPHQDENSDKGDPVYGSRLAFACLREVGLDTSTNPTVTSAQFTDATRDVIRVTLDLPNGGSLTTDSQDTDVRGFEVSDDTGSTFSNAGFTAAISGDDVLITKTSGSWTGDADTIITYNAGAPGWYGTTTNQEQAVAGMLYETYSPDNLGLGMPVSGSITEFEVANE